MHYYFYESTSTWVIVLSDMNDMVTLNVGINQISDTDMERISKVPDVIDAIDEERLKFFQNEKEPKLLADLIDPSEKNGKKYIGSCFCRDTLRIWKNRLEAKNRAQLVKAIDIQLDRLS
jgi:hypothetical protein